MVYHISVCDGLDQDILKYLFNQYIIYAKVPFLMSTMSRHIRIRLFGGHLIDRLSGCVCDGI